MSQFYARYIPPSSQPNGAVHKLAKDGHSSPSAQAGRHDGVERPLEPEKPKRKREPDDKTSSNSRKRSKSDEPKRPKKAHADPENEGASTSVVSAATAEGSNVLDRYSISKFAQKADAEFEVRRPKKKRAEAVEDLSAKESTRLATKKSKKRKAEGGAPIIPSKDPEGENDSIADNSKEILKHAGVMSKFAKSKETAAQIRAVNQTDDRDALVLRSATAEERPELHGLEPLPQPLPTEIPLEKPAYSTLPPWLAAPIIVPVDSDTSFESLGISKGSIANLRDKKLERAFPIQATVIPLLCEGPRRHSGDLCISAATGSGKTLAYVLPMVESLKRYVTTKLRGLIVVPTRELVNQVRATCDMCATGTNLKIATALGSKSLAGEQDLLIEVEDVYDPTEYRKAMEQPIDWSTFSMDEIFDRIRDEDQLDSLDRVKRFSSKVDILICTPGRLVDHLRSTTGFSLADVKWLVIDEADRLLGESYQEWVEVVMPALESRVSTSTRDELLQHMRLDVPERQITKVALSATMTQDISKLNSLNLRKPRMVVLGDVSVSGATKQKDKEDYDAEPIPDANGVFNLPATVTESVISVGDGEDKPLLLLELLISQVTGPRAARNNSQVLDSEQEASDSDTSSSSLDTDTSTDSDSDISSTSESSTTKRGSPLESKKNKTPASTPNKPQRALIFTRSAESATRLSRLLSLLDPTLAKMIATLTLSTTSSASSRKAMHSFRQGNTSILIATDRASRGLDVPDLEHVISYDVPASASTYVHRVGRTARAGKTGKAWTLLAHREARWFWKEIGKGESIQRNGKVARVTLSVQDEELKATYEEALKKLGEEVKGH